MIGMFVEGGPYAIVLGFLALVVIALTVKKAIDLFARTDLDPDRLGRGLNAILFWGCFSAVLGVLGQFSGIYRSLMVIQNAGLVHPGMVAKGLAISSITTLMGLSILGLAGIAWFGLRSRLHQLNDRREGGLSTGGTSHAG